VTWSSATDEPPAGSQAKPSLSDAKDDAGYDVVPSVEDDDDSSSQSSADADTVRVCESVCL